MNDPLSPERAPRLAVWLALALVAVLALVTVLALVDGARRAQLETVQELAPLVRK